MNKSESISIEESLKNSITSSLNSDVSFLLGLSGGPDSMALLYSFYKLGKNFLCVHINYGLRGKDSDLDQKLVEEMSLEWGFECCSVQLDSNQIKGNFQHWARKERYRIFRELKEEFDAQAIVTAHHKDDQVETILQKVLRGSGPSAWQGLTEWDGELFRPLLGFTKKEILGYCEANAIPYQEDKSNFEAKYARNFIRKELTESFNQFFPGWQANILELANHGLIVEQALDELLKDISSKKGLQISKLKAYPDTLRIAIIKRFLESKAGISGMSKGLLLQLNQLFNSETGKEIKISKNMRLVKNREVLSVKSFEDNIFTALNIEKEELKKPKEFDNFSIRLTNNKTMGNTLYMEAKQLVWPLQLRKWQKGDKLVPLGMTGSQKVSDHLTNRKIPSSKKEKSLILSGADGTIYAIFFPVTLSSGQHGTISDLVKCSDSTKEYLTVHFK